MSKNLPSFLHFVAIIFTGLAAAMTLLGGIGTTCVAFGAEKFGPRMAALIPVKPIFQVLVVISIAAAIYGIWAIVRLVNHKKGAYTQALTFLLVGGIASAVQFYYSATLRGSTAPNNVRLYLTVLALAVLLLMRLPGVWQKTGFGSEPQDSMPGTGGSPAGGALIVCGLVTITTPLWAAPTHLIDGINTANVLLWPLLGMGAVLVLLGGVKVIAGRREERDRYSPRLGQANREELKPG